MKKIMTLIAAMYLFAIKSTAQICPNETNLANTNVCGNYGDANGNSFWDWELNDPLNSNYCKNWYARTASTGFLTVMGSPFVNPGTGKLKIISDANDYTKTKGWELLQRKFGCLSEISSPYFILYNKFTGMIRVYVYLTANSGTYSQILMTIKSVTRTRPALLSQASNIMFSPDKYLAGQVGNSEEEVLISLNESVGLNNWSVGEFYASLDPNIGAGLYANAALEITVYGVVNNNLKAQITGTTVTSPDPLKNAMFITKSNSTGGSSFNFTASGEKLIKLSKSMTDFITGINENATKVYNKLNGNSNKFLAKLGSYAKFAKDNTESAADFNKIITVAAGFAGGAGQVLKFAGAFVGFLKESSADAGTTPMYTNYNLTVSGTITSQVVVQKFVVKVPATTTTPTNANNATYYNCNLGIFNFRTTPIVDTLTYDRRALLPGSINPKKVPKTVKYAAYRLHELDLIINKGAGLEVVNVEGALVAKVSVRPFDNYDPNIVNLSPLEEHPVRGFYRYFNHMYADILANRLLVTHFDADDADYHIIQTPYYSLTCIQNASINVNIPTMKVYMRLRATLRRTGNPTSELIYYVQDYEVDKVAGNPADIPTDLSYDLSAFPPYRNYMIPPNVEASLNINGDPATATASDLEVAQFGNVTLVFPQEIRRNHSIYTSSTYKTTIDNGMNNGVVTFRAGASVTMNPGFSTGPGSAFLATTDFGYFTLPCNASAVVAEYTNASGCYVTGIIAQKETAKLAYPVSIAEPSLYPNPAKNSFTIILPGINTDYRVEFYNQGGKKVYLSYKVEGNSIKVENTGNLVPGLYFASIQSNTYKKTIKLTIIR